MKEQVVRHKNPHSLSPFIFRATAICDSFYFERICNKIRRRANRANFSEIPSLFAAGFAQRPRLTTLHKPR